MLVISVRPAGHNNFLSLISCFYWLIIQTPWCPGLKMLLEEHSTKNWLRTVFGFEWGNYQKNHVQVRVALVNIFERKMHPQNKVDNWENFI